uniref:NADH-ubiquinone oxidoreductase chain 2 n=1 Tax=Mordellochroa milleri TaxID=1588259 RepID=A0A343C1P2_9CUCU|nr:NADH dehydrogenase subunit 2 [Mordellochroa milleri]
MLFFNSMILGTLIAISSYSWMGMWMGLEVNLLSIIPLMNSSKNKLSTEASLKYFLTQALASLILLFSIIVLLLLNEFIFPLMNHSMTLIMNSALLTKLGAAPFHFWFPEVMEGLTWFNCSILLTWQKIAPLILLMSNNPTETFIIMVAILSSLIGSLAALNQISLRKIMAFSSINHIGWMLAANLTSHSIWMVYFLTYSILTINMIWYFSTSNTFFMKQMINSISSNKMFKLMFIINFMSLGGLPPFLGFLPKWLIVQALTYQGFMFLAITLIILTLISLYIYLRLILSSLVILSTQAVITANHKPSYIFTTLNLFTLSSIVICPLILNSL